LSSRSLSRPSLIVHTISFLGCGMIRRQGNQLDDRAIPLVARRAVELFTCRLLDGSRYKRQIGVQRASDFVPDVAVAVCLLLETNGAHAPPDCIDIVLDVVA